MSRSQCELLYAKSMEEIGLSFLDGSGEGGGAVVAQEDREWGQGEE